MMRVIFLLLPIILTGCLEDKEANLAECRLKYDQDAAGKDGVMLCMSAKGYEFASGWEDGKLTQINGKCWNGKLVNGTGVPTDPVYLLSDCYSKRSLWNLLTH